MKQSEIRQAQIGSAATVTFTRPTVAVKQGGIVIVTAATVPIQTARTLKTVAA